MKDNIFTIIKEVIKNADTTNISYSDVGIMGLMFGIIFIIFLDSEVYSNY